MPLTLAPARTALVLVDLQNWTLALPLAPHSAGAVVANAVLLADAIRPAGTVMLTRAAFSAGYADMLKAPVDVELKVPEGGIPASALAFHPDVRPSDLDVIITKRQWSAFYGTELDLQLRRRGVTTVVLGGVMTNFGVESTARDAWQRNYAVLVAADACSSIDPDMHDFAVGKILPRVARVRSTTELIAALHSGG